MIRSRLGFVRSLTVVFLAIILLLGISCKSTYTPSTTPTQATISSPPLESGKSATINLSAEKVAFDKDTITVPVGVKVEVVFNNKESIPHNLAIYEDKTAKTATFKGEVVSGPKVVTYQFTAPAKPGTYFFRCDVHPQQMQGNFIVSSTGT